MISFVVQLHKERLYETQEKSVLGQSLISLAMCTDLTFFGNDMWKSLEHYTRRICPQS